MGIFMHIICGKYIQEFLLGMYLKLALLSHKLYTSVYPDIYKLPSYMFYHFIHLPVVNDFQFFRPCRILVEWDFCFFFCIWGLQGGASGKESSCQFRSLKRCGFNSWVGRSPGGGNDNPFWYSCLKNLMDRGPGGLQFTGLQKSWTWLSD